MSHLPGEARNSVGGAAPDVNADSSAGICARRLRVRGIVQGVGFRPFVWRLARQSGLAGDVLNDGDGVVVHLQGDENAVDEFESLLLRHCPPLAVIDSITAKSIEPLNGIQGFTIRASRHQSNSTAVSADAAICEACRAEIRDPQDRRHGYALSNCTHCGPRFSIIRGIPYDRGQTSMLEFTMCERCLAEYNNPADRRFHAQPNACPDCGPQLWLEDPAGSRASDSVIAAAAELLRAGKILAIKGIGGFHLACDARNSDAIMRLRQRKHRAHKPFALMAASVEHVARYCQLNQAEAAALQSPAAPVVILQKKHANALPECIAPGLQQWGFMLAYSPLHVLLMDLLPNPIVLTSGNISGEPQCIDNAAARTQLTAIADAFLMHNRGIINRVDDSVLRYSDGEIRCQRRARGYAPGRLSLPRGFNHCPAVLALGAEMKSTFCLLESNTATVSQHLGDLQNYANWQDFEANLRLYRQLFEFAPKTIVIDKHPDYLCARLGAELAQNKTLCLEKVQHHHAHVAACLADTGWPLNGGQVLAITLDGSGYADDGTVWGGEILLADYQQAERLAHLRPVALPGAGKAARQPWRNSYAHIRDVVDWEAFAAANEMLEIVKLLSTKPIKSLDNMIIRPLNSPLTSSCGRLLDAVAGAIGVCAEQLSYEGQAAMQMEALISDAALLNAGAYPFDVLPISPLQIDARPMWRALLEDLSKQEAKSIIAARFYNGLQKTLVNVTEQLAHQHGVRHVALSGGVFQSQRLLEGISRALRAKQLVVLQHQRFPCNDGSIALGQALVAAARQLTVKDEKTRKP